MRLSTNSRNFAEKFPSITENTEYLKLKKIPRHGCTNTFDHSVRVSRMNYRLARFFFLNRESAAKVGLLHDFCLIDYHMKHDDTHNGEWYCFYHPEDAIINSRRQGFSLNPTEEKAIECHMFPLSKHVPRSRLALLLILSDKAVALGEVMADFGEMISRKVLAVF